MSTCYSVRGSSKLFARLRAAPSNEPIHVAGPAFVIRNYSLVREVLSLDDAFPVRGSMTKMSHIFEHLELT